MEGLQSSLKIQLDVQDNALFLHDYILDLAKWEEEMKEKEVGLNHAIPCENDIPPPRNKIKRSDSNNENGENNSSKAKKISAYDYSSWDKFDAEKACAAVDENKIETIEEAEEESNDKNAEKTSLIDEAFYQKELGNNFVRKEEWNKAIKCYTKAISLDSENPIFYANSFKSAETDATAAIQLDKNYVKAYQRRAFARLALGQLAEAKSDFEEVLKIEPKSALARLEIDKIDKKLKTNSESIKTVPEKKTFDPKHIFKAQESSSKTSSVNATPNISPVKTNKSVKIVNKVVTDSSERVSTIDGNEHKIKESDDRGDGDKPYTSQSSMEVLNVFKPLPEWCEIVQPIKKAPHQRSKKPMRRVNIVQVDDIENTDDPTSKTIEPSQTKSKQEEIKCVSVTPTEEEISKAEILSLVVPKTATQFQNCWKIIKTNPGKAYSYLQQIPKNTLPQIFENNLESDLFSDLIAFLACDELKKDPELIYSFLVDLSRVKRFTSLIMFMSQTDKTHLKQCISELKASRTEEEISELLKLYELQL